jgi:hypothetical protein
MEVDALSIVALLLLLVALGSANVMRRKAARRAAEERARARARRRTFPEVSANVRGLPGTAHDLWGPESGAPQRKGRRA